MILRRASWLLLPACFGLLCLPPPALAREAAFVEPGTLGGKGAATEALIADPKNFDAGESPVGVTRRVSLFFINAGTAPLAITEVTTTGDSNVNVQREESSDCSPKDKIPGLSRCSVALAITPSSTGAWSVELLIRHDGIGRIARATVTGKAAVDSRNAARVEGLNITSRDMKPIDFSEVEVNGAPAVRTALMVNDSPETITIKSIDLIAVDQGLERLTTGCETDQQLKPDTSCPITLKWQPHARGNIATDLIMRHTGKIGFTVIPVRGKAIGDGGSAAAPASPAAAAASPAAAAGQSPSATAPLAVLGAAMPPSAEELESITGKLPLTVTESALRPSPAAAARSGSREAKIHLIGVVGRRAILQREGVTKTVSVGNEIEFAGTAVKLLALADREARVLVNGQTRSLTLGPSGYRPASASSSLHSSSSGNNHGGFGNNPAGISSNSQSSSGK